MMTPDQIESAQALNRCTFLPGSPEKRFAREIRARSEVEGAPELTPRQDWNLWRLVVRFRRQIDDDIVDLARENLVKYPELGPPRAR